MAFEYTIEQDLALTNLEIVREFDLSSLINNIRIKKDKGKINFVNINIDKYIEFIETSMHSITDITLDRKQVIGFKNLLNLLNDEALVDINVPVYFASNFIDIKSNYLKEYADNVALTIQRALEDSISAVEIDRFVTDEITKKVKKQMVRTNDNITLTGNPEMYVGMYDYPIHKLKVDEIFKTSFTPLTNEYIINNILPFIDKFDTYKIKYINENKQAIENITYAHEIVNLYFKVINDEMKNASKEKAQKLSYLIYNITRTIYEVSSFLAFMIIHRNGLFIKDVNVCKNVYDKIQRKASIPTVESVTTESVFDTGVVSNDTSSITRGLMVGDVDAFTVLANNIYEYNKGIISNTPESPLNILGDDMHSQVETLLDEQDYNRDAYDETIKAFISIGDGLDIIAANSDDYLMVFNDIISKAGFGIDLNHRFSNVVDSIDIITEYESGANIAIPEGTPNDLYLKMLKEVKDYPENMRKVADTINICKTKIDYLKDRFNHNINGEYKNAEAINELKIFFDDLLEQMRKFINDIGSKYMIRLKKIALEMNKINDKRSTVLSDVAVEESYSDLEINGYDSFEEIVNSYEAVTDYIFDVIMTEYTIRREKEVRGVDIVLEADEPNKQTDTTTPQQPTQQPANNNNQNNQKQQNTQNNQQPAKASKIFGKTGKLASFAEKLNVWYNKLIEKLNGIIQSAYAKRDKAYLDNNREALLNKRYSNTTSKREIIEYEKFMPNSNILNDLKSLVSKTGSGNLNSIRLNKAQTDSALINIVFGNRPPASVWENKENIAANITKYYKCGLYDEKPVYLRGNELKRVVNDAVDYCYVFYDKTLPQIKGDITKIKTNLENASKMLLQESVENIDFDLLFTEADDSQIQEVNNIAKKCDIIRNYVQIYSNAIMTAVFDRYKDYMGLLRSIIQDNTQNNENQ